MNIEDNTEKKTTDNLKIGLALSGGGFRASIFHLGVIRRLEELGIMKEVDVISAVSGGSIVAAYYVIQMEIRLRAYRDKIKNSIDEIGSLRLKICNEITDEFLLALDHNLRTRVLFAPFYHPIGWIKSLFPGYSRSDLLQGDYDKFFYHNNTLDQLPTVTEASEKELSNIRLGPKLILNTTSLIDGQRKEFYRESVSGFSQIKKINHNVHPLSRVVGASSCVPGLFPAVSIEGQVLVDGGVADNQGIEGLIENDCDVLLVSDASGQFEVVNKQSSGAAAVLSRTMSVLQKQIRDKLVDRLKDWKNANSKKEYAWFNLFSNLKEISSQIPRVPSEYIPGLARIRTDLDQFGLIEREVLMYHGYTLIDAKITQHCPLLKARIDTPINQLPSMKVPPLFWDLGSSIKGQEKISIKRRRKRIKHVLETGKIPLFLIRSFKKFPLYAGAVYFVLLLLPLRLFWEYWNNLQGILEFGFIPDIASTFKARLIPDWLDSFITSSPVLNYPITAEGITILMEGGLFIYFLLFINYLLMRRLIRRWDLKDYETLTDGHTPTTGWK